jgi:hypothetical protein
VQSIAQSDCIGTRHLDLAAGRILERAPHTIAMPAGTRHEASFHPFHEKGPHRR